MEFWLISISLDMWQFSAYRSVAGSSYRSFSQCFGLRCTVNLFTSFTGLLYEWMFCTGRLYMYALWDYLMLFSIVYFLKWKVYVHCSTCVLCDNVRFYLVAERSITLLYMYM